jgi:hypothetical protein|tara:strand:- start:176 stop:448 length:273 start_codon:yes stop_codon:yes gene_type:complete
MAIDDVFDFGFTSANLEELDEWQQSQSELSSASEEATVYKARLDKLYKSFLPLLTNLKQDPEKDYLLWPEREAKVEAFEKHLKDIYQGIK